MTGKHFDMHKIWSAGVDWMAVDKFCDLSRIVETLEGETKSFKQSVSTLLGWMFPCRELCMTRQDRLEARAQRHMKREFKKRKVQSDL